MKTLFGGSSSKSSSSSGFDLLPPELQNAWNTLGTQATNTLAPVSSSASMFKLPDLSQGGQSALNSIYKGFTPDAGQLQSDINMQMNPFDSSVIDTINRESAGQNSALSSYLTNAGQFGSNRGALGANDIDLSRLNQIGTFKQNEFQTALNNALTTLPQLRMQSTQGGLNAGLLQQQQGQQNQLAPVSALQALAQVTGVLPQSGGSTASGSSSSQGGIIPGIFGSSRDIKENIKFHGYENGYRIYHFNYLGDDVEYRGVMADEVMEIMPEAVIETDLIRVNYDMLGIKFGVANGHI